MDFIDRQRTRRRHLEVVPVAFLASPVEPPFASADELLGSITLKANRVKYKITRQDLLPYDAWLDFGIAQLTMPVVGNFDTNAILHPGWLVYITETGS